MLQGKAKESIHDEERVLRITGVSVSCGNFDV